MNTSAIRSSLAGLAFFGVLTTSLAAPALADGAASTRNIIGAAAAIIGIATAVNVSNKNQVANTVEGYLSDGSVVYEDGHVVDRNGNSWYPGNQGEQVSCNGQSCFISNSGQYNAGYVAPYNNGYTTSQYNVQFYSNNRNERNDRNDRRRDTRRPPNA